MIWRSVTGCMGLLIAVAAVGAAMGATDPGAAAPAAPTKRGMSVEEGRKFWSFQPLTRPAPPAVKNDAWARTPIDRFVLAKMEEKGLSPNAASSREKLIRR